MNLSTKGRYGTRAMLDVALHSQEGPVHLSDIAKRQQISKKYLGHLTSRLEAAGLLRGTRGPGGGISLTRPASEIRLSDILRVLEGGNALVDCVDSSDRCPRSPSCATRDVWREMGEVLGAFLDSKTLEDICRQQRDKDQSTASIYHI